MYAYFKVMTTNPECGTVDMPILDALHTMHDGKFLHLPVVDRGSISVQYSLFFQYLQFKLFFELLQFLLLGTRWEYSNSFGRHSYHSCGSGNGRSSASVNFGVCLGVLR